MADVALKEVNKKYGAVEVIPSLDLEIEDGEFVVLVGPSGCGKSTLVRMIAGLEGISGGELSIGDRIVNDVPPSDRDIAMVFQSYALYPHKTVAQNMGFSLKIRSISKEDVKHKVDEAAEILGLTPYLDRYPRALSGGQRQRVAMGRAIVRDPSVFLFDEPLSNLDAKLRVKMRAEIRELHQRLKTTTVYVTHDQIEAMTMADKIVLLRDGHIEQVGTPLELYDNPANTFVAGFIGSPSINLLDATISSEDNGAADVAGGRLPIPSSHNHQANDGIIIGLRPEDLEPAKTGIPATVKMVEPTGAESHVGFDSAVGSITVVLSGRTSLSRGDQVHLACSSDKIHLFEKSTTKKINTNAGRNHA